MNAVFAAQAHPASIGFSALAGAVDVVLPEDDKGLFIGLIPRFHRSRKDRKFWLNGKRDRSRWRKHQARYGYGRYCCGRWRA